MKNKIIFIILAMFILNGMNNARQLNDLAIISAIGVDINEKGEYIITSQILNSKKENSSGTGGSSSKNSSDIVVYNSTSKSIQNAIRNTIEESPRRLYLAHMDLLLISEKVARQKNILDELDFFIRDNEGSNDFMLVITKNTNPQKVLEVLTPLETNPSKNIKDSIIASSKYKGICTDKTLSENMSMFLKDGQGAVLTSIELDYGNDKTENSEILEQEKKITSEITKRENETNQNDIISEEENNNNNSEQEFQKDVGKSSGNKEIGLQTNLSQSDESKQNNNSEESNSLDENSLEKSSNVKIKISYLGYFRNKSLDGYLNYDSSFMYNLLNNNVKSGVIKSGDGDDLIVVDVLKAKVNKKPKMENDKFKMDVDINITCSISEVGENVKFHESDNIKKYQNQLENTIKENVEEFIKLSQTEYNCDLMAYGITFYKKKTKEYNKMMEMYSKEEYFKHIESNINVKVKFENEGGIYNTW